MLPLSLDLEKPVPAASTHRVSFLRSALQTIPVPGCHGSTGVSSICSRDDDVRDSGRLVLLVDSLGPFLPFDGERPPRRPSNELEEEQDDVLRVRRGLRFRSLDLCDRLRRGLSSSEESWLEPRLRLSREDHEEELLSARRAVRRLRSS